MPPDAPDTPRDIAISQLQALGLNAYAARTFVALVSLGEATAREVSEVADVPRTRVYDATDDLRNRGLVDVQQSTPKRFWAVSADTIGRHFEQDYRYRVDRMLEALDSVGSAPRTAEQRGVWTVTGRGAVEARVIDFVDSATEEIVYMSVGALLTEAVVERLRAASDRGVAIKLATMADGPTEDMRRAVPGAEQFDSLWEWTDEPAGRLLMVDRAQTLVSVLVNDGPGEYPEQSDETAIWGSGDANGLVVVLRAMFTWQLDGDPA